MPWQWFDPEEKGEVDVRFLADVLFEMGIVARARSVRWLATQLLPATDGAAIRASVFIEWWFYNRLPPKFAAEGLRARLIRSRLRMRQRARRKLARLQAAPAGATVGSRRASGGPAGGPEGQGQGRQPRPSSAGRRAGREGGRPSGGGGAGIVPRRSVEDGSGGRRASSAAPAVKPSPGAAASAR